MYYQLGIGCDSVNCFFKYGWVLIALFLFFSCVSAIPMQLPVQGKLKGQNAGDVNKQLPMTFSIYSVASGGAAIWSQTKNVDVNIIDVDNNIGVFSTLIGDTVLLDFNSHTDMNFLGIKIQSNAELSPRIRIGATAYAYVAKRLAAVEDLNLEGFGVKSFGDSNFNRLYANFLFGNGAGLTGVLATTNWVDINAHVYGKLDVNRQFESLLDLNSFYYKKTDINAHFYGIVDLNRQFVPYIGATKDVNLNFRDLNAKSISAVAFFGSGAALTGLPSTGGTVTIDVNVNEYNWLTTDLNKNYYGKLDVNRHFHSLIDLNTFYYKKTDVNGNFEGIRDLNLFYYKMTDVNSHFQGKVDLNAGFVGFIRTGNATDLNLAQGGITAWDGNFYTLKANYLFGDASGVTGVLTLADGNAHYVPYIGADFDTNLGGNGLTAWDGNYYTVKADYFFGNGAGLTGVTSTTNWADINAHVYGKLDVNAGFVPYIGAAKDVNLGVYGLKSFSSDVNFNAVYARQFFGSGVNLTGIPTQSDINANFYGKLDVNAHFVPYVGATKDVNLWAYTISAYWLRSYDGGISLQSGDMDITNGGLTVTGGGVVADTLEIFGTAQFDADVNVTGKFYSWDINTQFVPYVAATRDLNLNYHDLNARSISAAAFFGSGASLTGLPSSGGTVTIDANVNEYNWLTTDLNKNYYGKLDVNNHFVPYIGATKEIISNYRITLTSTGIESPELILSNSSGTLSFYRDGVGNQIDTGGDDFFLNAMAGKSFSPADDASINEINLGLPLKRWAKIYALDLNIARDLNVGRAIYAPAYFGSGAGLTGVTSTTNWADINAHIYGKLDVNNQFVPYIGATKDLNLNSNKIKAFGDSNFNALYARKFFGDGSALTGISGLPSDMNQAYYSQLDANRVLESKVDLNTFFYRKTDINAGWYGKLDVNTHFVPYVSTNTSINIRSDLNISKSVNKGVSIQSDANRICFPSNSCEFKLDWNGTAMVFGS